LLALHFELGLRRAIDVITFKIDFKPSGFDRPVTQHFKERVATKLIGAGISSLSVTIKRGPHRELVLHFDGAEEEIEKAKAALAAG
jgi:hypothetical protein